MNELSEKQKKFIREYLIDLNGTQAAIRAGYCANSARPNAARMLANANIQDGLRKERQKISEETKVTPESVIRELAIIGYADLSDFVEWGPNGVRLKDSKLIHAVKRRAIIEVSQSLKDGLRIKLADKKGALDSIGKHLGLFVDRAANLNIDLSSLTEEQLERIASGEDPFIVVATPRKGGTGAASEAEKPGD